MRLRLGQGVGGMVDGRGASLFLLSHLMKPCFSSFPSVRIGAYRGLECR